MNGWKLSAVGGELPAIADAANITMTPVIATILNIFVSSIYEYQNAWYIQRSEATDGSVIATVIGTT